MEWASAGHPPNLVGRYTTPDRGAREAAFRDLCDRMRADPARWLGD